MIEEIRQERCVKLCVEFLHFAVLVVFGVLMCPGTHFGPETLHTVEENQANAFWG